MFSIVAIGENQVTISLPGVRTVEGQHVDFREVYADIPSGTDNSELSVSFVGADTILIDEVTVGREDEMLAAEVHRKVSALSLDDQQDLMAYLQQIDQTSAMVVESNASENTTNNNDTGNTESSTNSDSSESAVESVGGATNLWTLMFLLLLLMLYSRNLRAHEYSSASR